MKPDAFNYDDFLDLQERVRPRDPQTEKPDPAAGDILVYYRGRHVAHVCLEAPIYHEGSVGLFRSMYGPALFWLPLPVDPPKTDEEVEE